MPPTPAATPTASGHGSRLRASSATPITPTGSRRTNTPKAPTIPVMSTAPATPHAQNHHQLTFFDRPCSMVLRAWAQSGQGAGWRRPPRPAPCRSWTYWLVVGVGVHVPQQAAAGAGLAHRPVPVVAPIEVSLDVVRLVVDVGRKERADDGAQDRTE